MLMRMPLLSKVFRVFSFAFLLGSLTFFSSKAQASFGMEFSRSVYTALDLLDSMEFNKHKKALEYLLHAREFASNDETQEALLKAIDILKDTEHSADTAPTSATLAQIKTFLANAIVANRITLNSSYLEESKLLENLIKVHLFKENYAAVKVTYENIPREKAVSILMSYLVDPRTLKYDPQAIALITGKNQDGTPAGYRVIFALDSQTLEVPAGSTEKDLGAMMNDLKKESEKIFGESPIRPKIRYLDPFHVTVWLEVVGMKNAQLLDYWIRNTAGLATGNRFIEWSSRKLVQLGTALQFSSMKEGSGGILAQAGTALETTGNFFKNTLAKGRIMESTDYEMVESFAKRTAQRIVDLNPEMERNTENLNKVLESLKPKWTEIPGSKMRLPEVAAANDFITVNAQHYQDALKSLDGLTKNADLWKQDIFKNEFEFQRFLVKYRLNLEALLAPETIDKAAAQAAELAASEARIIGDPAAWKAAWAKTWSEKWKARAQEYVNASKTEADGLMQDMRREAVEDARGSAFKNWAYWMKVYTGVLLAYHSYDAISAAVRAADPRVREEIIINHLPRIIKDTIFFVPAGIEFAVFYDLLGGAGAKTLKGVFDLDIGFKNLDDRLAWIVSGGAEILLYRSRGTTSFDSFRQELESKLGLVPLYTFKNRTWTHELVKTRHALMDKSKPMDPKEVEDIKKHARDQLGSLAARYAALCFILSDHAKGKFESRLGEFEGQLFADFFGSSKSLLNTATLTLQ